DVLHAPTTRYVLVTTPEPHGGADALAFAGEASRHGVYCSAVVVNRMLDIGDLGSADLAAGTRSADASEPASERRAWPAPLSRKLVHCAQDLKRLTTAQRQVIDRLRLDLDRIGGSGGAQSQLWLELPAMSPAPVDRRGIALLAAKLIDHAETRTS